MTANNFFQSVVSTLKRVRLGRYTRQLKLSVMLVSVAGLSMLGFSTLWAAPDPTGLTAHWSFNEGSGAVLGDSSGNGHNGSLVSTPTWTNGQLGGALAFDGTDYVEAGNLPAINSAQKVSMSAWIKRNAAGSRVLIGKQANNHDITIEAWNDGFVYFQVSNGSNASGKISLNDTNWHHVALVYDGTQTGNSNRLKGYVDGVQQTLAFSGTIPATTTANTTPFRIGRLGNDYSRGNIDDAWLFARALSTAEVQDLAGGSADTQAPSIPSNLTATAVSQTQIDLSWQASTDNVGVQGYRVYRGGNLIATVTSGTTYQNTGLTADTSYSYTVAAYDAAANASTQSSAVNASTPLIPPQCNDGTDNDGDTLVDLADPGCTSDTDTSEIDPDTQAPTVPADLSATAVSATQINLSWSASSDNIGVTGYRVYRDGVERTTVAGTSFQDSGLAPNTQHSYTVTAYDAANNQSTESQAASATTPEAPAGPAFPLRVSDDKRRLQDSLGQPFLINADTPWSLFVGPDLAGARQYLDNRQQKGINAVLVNLIEHKFNGPVNANGDTPFTGTLSDGTTEDFTTPKEAYFAYADQVISEAASRGIVVFMTPAYLGYLGGDEGWYQEVTANGPERMLEYGRYVGERYKNYNNIVWVMGGDWGPNAAIEEIRAMVQGINETAGQVREQLFTVHNQRHQSGVTAYPLYTTTDSWIDINTTYSDCVNTPKRLLDDYNRAGPIPFFYIEGYYEGEYSTTRTCLRSQAYWPALMGATGHFYGNKPVWLFDPGWQTALDSDGAYDMKRVGEFFASRPWYSLVPDNSHVTLTGGYGNILDSSYAPAARTADGGTVIVYTPSQRALTINMTRISGTQATAWWYNPATGDAVNTGNFATTGSRQFTPPSSGDWLLVLDDASLNLPAPGGATTPVPPTPSVVVTAPSNNSVVSGTAVTLTASPANTPDFQGVQFKINGVDFGSEITAAPFSINWDTTAVADGAYTITAVARYTDTSVTSTSVSVTVQNTAPVPPANGLVGAWDFNEGTGTTFADTSGNANHGILTGAGATWSTSGKYGGALSFDGTAGKGEVAPSQSLALTSSHTISAWVKPTALGGYQTILVKETGSCSSIGYWLQTRDSRISGGLNNGSGGCAEHLTGTISMPIGTWSHLAVVFDDAANTYKLYLNGNLVVTQTENGAPAATNSPILFGQSSYAGGNYERWRGLIDDVRIYNRALTAAEIQADMNVGL